MYNEHNSLTSRHKIILDELTCHSNKDIIENHKPKSVNKEKVSNSNIIIQTFSFC